MFQDCQSSELCRWSGASLQHDPSLSCVLPGIAVPVGEAHRHEPPIPHDKVVVDEGQDQEGPEEKKPPPKLTDEGDPGDRGQVAPPPPGSEREEQEPERGEAGKRLEQAPAVVEAEHPQKVPEANGQPPVQPRKEDSRPDTRDLHPVPQSRLSVEQSAVVAGEGGEEAAQKADGVQEKPAESDLGECLPPWRLGGGGGCSSYGCCRRNRLVPLSPGSLIHKISM